MNPMLIIAIKKRAIAAFANLDPNKIFEYLRKNKRQYPAHKIKVINNFIVVTYSGCRNQCIPPTISESVRQSVPINNNRNAACSRS
jgi:hypothetical protein